MAESSDWDAHARWWQDGFTAGADPEYEEQIIPLARRELKGARRVLDVGTGEGQLARLVRGRAVGVDPTWAQITEAARRRGGPRYAQAGAARLPFRSAVFDCVVACLVFEHITDVDDAIAEVARVLEPGGRFCFFLNHPLLQTPNSGWIDDHILEELGLEDEIPVAALAKQFEEVFVPGVADPIRIPRQSAVSYTHLTLPTICSV